jgi:hypothetical protein
MQRDQHIFFLSFLRSYLRSHLRSCAAAVMCAMLASLVNACSGEPEESEGYRAIMREDSLRMQRRADSVRKIVRVKKVQDSVPLVTYKRLVIKSRERLDSIRSTYNREKNFLAYRAFTTINRKNLRFFRVGDTCVVPSAVHKDLRVYSAFPHVYPAADTIAKLVLVSNKLQCYACYERGKLIRFAACNTGEERKPTFPGRYAMNWRDKIRRSSLDSTWVLPWTWNIHLYAGSAFHEFDMPGRPVSHSCVRQFAEDAEWLYSWGKGATIDTVKKKYIAMTGTPVIILDVFDFQRRRGGPWWDMRSNRDSLIKLPTAPMLVEEALIPLSQIPEDVRGMLPNKQRYLSAEDTLRKRGVIREGVDMRESVNFNKLRRQKAIAKAKQDALELQNAQKALHSLPVGDAVRSEQNAQLEQLERRADQVNESRADLEEAALRETFMPAPKSATKSVIKPVVTSAIKPAINSVIKPAASAFSAATKLNTDSKPSLKSPPKSPLKPSPLSPNVSPNVSPNISPSTSPFKSPNKSLATPTTKPTTTSVTNPALKPATDKASRFSATSNGKPNGKPSAKSATKPVLKPSAKTTVKPPSAKPTSKSASKPASKPASKQILKPTTKPAAKTRQ